MNGYQGENRENIFRELGKRVFIHSPLEIFILLCSLAGAVYTGYSLDLIQEMLKKENSLSLEYEVAFASLVLIVLCSLGFLLGRTSRGFRFLLFVKIFAVESYISLIQPTAPEEMLILVPFLLEIAIFEAFFVNLAFSQALIVLTFLLQASGIPPGDVDSTAGGKAIFSLAHAGYFTFLSLFSFVASFLVYYREKVIDQRERVSQLESAVSKLTESNLGYQRYANEVSAKSQVEERLRITRELHDIVGYTFTNNIMMLEAAVAKIKKDPE
jgi:signal transduction histidine kinase